jgi:hypothetical protein
MDRAVTARLLRLAGAAGLAGVMAGLLVGGVGGRIAMRVSGALSDAALVGTPTAAGNRVGEITLAGTIAIAFFSGALPGVIAGAGYAAMRPWLAPFGRWAGLAFGIGLLAAMGPAVLESFNFDFRRFGPAALNVAMFALLFPLFGVTVAWILGMVEPRILAAPLGSPWAAAGAFGALILGLVLVIGGNALLGSLGGGFVESDPRAFFLLWYAAVPALAQAALAGAGGLGDARALALAPRVVTYALLLGPVLVGAPATIGAILFLLR